MIPGSRPLKGTSILLPSAIAAHSRRGSNSGRKHPPTSDLSIFTSDIEQYLGSSHDSADISTRASKVSPTLPEEHPKPRVFEGPPLGSESSGRQWLPTSDEPVLAYLRNEQYYRNSIGAHSTVSTTMDLLMALSLAGSIVHCVEVATKLVADGVELHKKGSLVKTNELKQVTEDFTHLTETLPPPSLGPSPSNQGLKPPLKDELSLQPLAGPWNPIDCPRAALPKNWDFSLQNRTSNENDTGSSVSVSPSGSIYSRTSYSSGNTNSKRIRMDGEDSKGDGNGDKPPRPPDNRTRSYDSGPQRFACPFRKHNPEKYNVLEPQWRNCTSPFTSVARLKEHLFRKHKAPKCCPRCGDPFKTNEEISTHLSSTEACLPKPRLPLEGITDEVEKKLRTRKKTFSELSGVEKWKDIYQLLFPGEPVPSPFCTREEVEPSPNNSALDDYEAYLREELPRQFRSALESCVQETFLPIEERLKGEIIRMVEDCQERAFSSYRDRIDPSLRTPIAVPPDEASALSNSPLNELLENSFSYFDHSDFVLNPDTLTQTRSKTPESLQPASEAKPATATDLWDNTVDMLPFTALESPSYWPCTLEDCQGHITPN